MGDSVDDGVGDWCCASETVVGSGCNLGVVDEAAAVSGKGYCVDISEPTCSAAWYSPSFEADAR